MKVPTLEIALTGLDVDIPKSPTIHRPFLSTNIFFSLRSLWIINLEWSYFTPTNMSINISTLYWRLNFSLVFK